MSGRKSPYRGKDGRGKDSRGRADHRKYAQSKDTQSNDDRSNSGQRKGGQRKEGRGYEPGKAGSRRTGPAPFEAADPAPTRASTTATNSAGGGSPVDVTTVTATTVGATEKLQKVLAGFGLGSRRTMESWIEAGRIRVNGERAHLGQRVGPEDRIQVDNAKPLKLRRDHTRVLLLNKSVGTVCSRSDPEQRPTVFQGLPRLKQGRWISVGRLDIQTSGLLLLTNNGTLAHRLMHPSTGLDREYAVRVTGQLDDATLAQLKAGVEIDGEIHRFSDIQYFDGRGVNHWYHVVLMEGKNREVRRLFESVGLLVSRLKRVRYGPVILPPGLPVGQRTELEPEDVLDLLRLVRLEDDLAAPVPGGRSRRRRVIESKDSSRRRRTVLTAYPDLDLEV